ncbi:IS200/IS605 family element RNA-guided endonuclease TnpB [Ktedonobacter racemifer]|uniref:Transposase, IS605 OrfB family n=1 Tax=Ktedonobacter racemifer DSM 44963 TaxID=485913 RepID=D6TG85_KTERA|nr:IS200/IS605 family element RNA-guided endonuclease TnpB [Ktedonobacter racemifer]EFH88787.1 transposase, IS605 OrfB family [Ktedonobacter racemifer DSM 44963]
MKQKRAFKYRVYPTPEQQQMLAQTFGCCRFVYNWALRKKTDAYYKDHQRLYYKDLSILLTDLKQQEEMHWLNAVSSVPLQQALRHLDKAFLNFFEGRAKYPTFHKKRNQQSATYTSNAFTWRTGTLTLAKMREPLDIRWSRPLPKDAIPSSVTISKDCANRYFISILVEDDIAHLPVIEQAIGADLGLKSFVALSTGEIVGNPKFFHKDEKKLAKAQRRHAKKKKGSKNRDKARLKVARIHARIADRRRDFLHKLSTRLIRENQVVCVESLAVKNMVKNGSLAKAISDVGWSEFVAQLEYKADWYGRALVKIDKWYPSSKRCFDCGHILDSLTLDVRQWDCPECGVHHDRDINAANNILAVGLTVNACGEAVRPGAVKTKPGKSRRSRKA